MSPIIKIKVLPKPQIRGKMDVKFPANVLVTNFLTVTKANGTYTSVSIIRSCQISGSPIRQPRRLRCSINRPRFIR